MEYPVEWQKVVGALARELAQAKIQLAMANAVIESLSGEVASSEEPSPPHEELRATTFESKPHGDH